MSSLACKPDIAAETTPLPGARWLPLKFVQTGLQQQLALHLVLLSQLREEIHRGAARKDRCTSWVDGVPRADPVNSSRGSNERGGGRNRSASRNEMKPQMRSSTPWASLRNPGERASVGGGQRNIGDGNTDTVSVCTIRAGNSAWECVVRVDALVRAFVVSILVGVEKILQVRPDTDCQVIVIIDHAVIGLSVPVLSILARYVLVLSVRGLMSAIVVHSVIECMLARLSVLVLPVRRLGPRTAVVSVRFLMRHRKC